MLTSRVQAFVKFFDNEEYAYSFLRGSLFMRRLGYFQKTDASDFCNGRSDPTEGIVALHQPDKTEITINFGGFEPINIGENDLAGPVSISKNFYSDMYVFCISTLTIPDPALLKGNHKEVETQLQTAFKVDERCFKFGPYAVVVRPDKFLRNLRNSLTSCDHWYKAAMVEYYDETKFHGEFLEQNVPFRKQNRYSYQKEYRVCLQILSTIEETIKFEIGSISEFAFKARSSELNSNLRVTLKNS